MTEFTRCDSVMCPRQHRCMRWLLPRGDGTLLYAVPPFELEGACDAFMPQTEPYHESQPLGQIVDERA